MSNTKQNEKILVIKLSAFGDFIQALGPMAAIKNHHKDADITLLTTAPYKKFAEKCGYFDHIKIDERPKALNISAWVRLRSYLNAQDFTRVYDLQNNDRTALYFRLFKRSQKPEWVGTARGASHRNTSETRTQGHAFDGHVQTLGNAGVTGITVDPLDWIDEDISAFSLKAPYVLIAAGSAPQHPQKRWPKEHYAAFANAIAKQGFQPVLLGTADEKEINAFIAEKCPKALNLNEQTSLFHIAALGRNAAGAVGNDTGPMHLIAATSCPCLGLFSGYSHKIKHAPKGENVQILQTEHLKDLDLQTVLKQFKPNVGKC